MAVDDVAPQSCVIINHVLKVSHTSWIYCITTIQERLLNLALNVPGPSYLGLTRSISWAWLLMPWLHTSPGHQRAWYRLCGICRSCSYFRTDFKYLCHTNVKWVSEWVIKYNDLIENSRHRSPYSPYKPRNYSLYIGIIVTLRSLHPKGEQM